MTKKFSIIKYGIYIWLLIDKNPKFINFIYIFKPSQQVFCALLINFRQKYVNNFL